MVKKQGIRDATAKLKVRGELIGFHPSPPPGLYREASESVSSSGTPFLMRAFQPCTSLQMAHGHGGGTFFSHVIWVLAPMLTLIARSIWDIGWVIADRLAGCIEPLKLRLAAGNEDAGRAISAAQS